MQMDNKLTFHHIGVACEDIDEMSLFVREQYDIVTESDTVFDDLQNANLRMLTDANGFQIELISGAQVERLVKKRNFLYHTCYSCKNIEEKVRELEVMQGNMVVSMPTPAILFENKKVAFVSTKLGLIELVEE